jgi:hypothetical protein
MSSAPNSSLLSGALTGFAKGSDYDKHRPSYPAEAVSALISNLGLAGKEHAPVIELAAGTGKFTELLAVAKEQFEIIAVEPHDGMRVELERKKLQGVSVKKGFADKIPVEDGWADSLICAQVRFEFILILVSRAPVLQSFILPSISYYPVVVLCHEAETWESTIFLQVLAASSRQSCITNTLVHGLHSTPKPARTTTTILDM